MKVIRPSLVLLTLSGVLGVSLLGPPLGVIAMLAAVMVVVRLWVSYFLPDGLWNILLFFCFVGIAVWVGGVSTRLASGLGLALIVLQVQRIWQCRSPTDERVLTAIALIELVLVGSQTTAPLFFVAWCGWLMTAPSVLMGTQGISNRVRGWTLICLCGATSLFFVVLPRFQSPALEPGASQNGTIGFAQEITLGDLGELLEDDTPVLRVQMGPVDEAPLYFRGVSMDAFDGTGWRRTGAAVSESDDSADTHSIWVEVLAEPETQGIVFTLGRVYEVVSNVGSVWQDADQNWFIDGPTGSKRYRFRTDMGGVRTAKSVDPRWLQVPETLSDKLAPLAASVVKDAGSTLEKMELMSAWLQNNAEYTRDPRDAAREDPVETFLFETKEGHCEYFSSALALLLRTQGVPTRVVNGFIGGEYNETGGYWVVRQAHAHAWVEALDDDGRWRRLDATPQEIAPALLDARVRQWSETLEWWWMSHVVAYDRRTQWTLAETPIWGVQNLFASASKADGSRSMPWLGLLVVCSALLIVWVCIRRLWWLQQRRWLGQQSRLRGVALLHTEAWSLLRAEGLKPPQGPTLRRAEWMEEHVGVAGAALKELVWLHYRVQFGGESDAELHPEAIRVMRTIRERLDERSQKKTGSF